MTDKEVEEFRAQERARMAPMREAARKEAFVQGFLRGKFGELSKYSDLEILDQLSVADDAYAKFIKTRSPA